MKKINRKLKILILNRNFVLKTKRSFCKRDFKNCGKILEKRH